MQINGTNPVKKIAMAGGTFAVAMGIGFFMQQGDAAAGYELSTLEPGLEAEIGQTAEGEVMEASYAAATGAMETSAQAIAAVMDASPEPQPAAPVALASAEPESDAMRALTLGEAEPLALEDDVQAIAPQEIQAEVADNALSCESSLSAEPAAAAMVSLNLSAPCQPNARITIHHEGMMFTVVTDDAGAAVFDAPALSAEATFIAAFPNGEGAVAQAEVSSLDFFDRVVVQWAGDAGFELHAMEFGATYGEEGHVWSGASRDVATAARGKGGFLTMLGDPSAAQPRLAEVYTFPSGMMSRDGQVSLTVEAEVTATNCARDIEAQTLQVSPNQPIQITDLTLAVPECEAIGEFLVMGDLVDELVLAAN